MIVFRAAVVTTEAIFFRVSSMDNNLVIDKYF